ncbi:hypothetical protein HXX76_006698 [Chlamydomonas incerta]|uniref:Uncharacterized protein n=1 Tax=Chlamydomonas incerta TaxID=51695 RepID=A0A835W5E9_CHLIN|nr:hypothetical protein HXX76_006698 [Chlamydomonas incerta]|eukprot:KAG2436391.1 hypothetical protein HXX76_006698 [Chlamydomonas incerta]
MDPLSVLRDFNTSDRLHLVQHLDGNVQFGDRYNFPASTPVYKKAGASAYYTLHDVLFYLKNRQLKPQEYVMAASQAGLGIVNIMDRKKMLEVLDGLTVLDPSLVPVGVVVPLPQQRQAAAAAEEPQAKRQRVVDDEASAMRGLMEQERQLRNRNTMLVAPHKDFRKVLEVVANAKKQAHKQAAAAAATAKQAASAKQAAAAKQPAASRPGSQLQSQGAGASSSSRYGRDNTADQLKAMGAGKGGIDMYGTSGSRAAAAPPPPPPAAAAGYVPVRKSGSSAPPPPPPSSSSKPGKSAPAAAPASGKGSGKEGAKKGGVPIIIVPSGMTSLINMHNARSFLEEGLFMPTQQAIAASGGAPKATQITIRRTAHRQTPVEYMVTDKPPAKDSPDWDRVAAVIVQGAKWQFKDWPHKGAKDGDLVDALGKVCGFFVHFSDEKVAQPVSDWNVRTVPLHRESRHKDMTAMLELYRHLDVFLQAKRSTLAY